jgi:Tol biopolymer transport system component
MRSFLALVTALAALVGFSAPAQATFAGKNGKIAFSTWVEEAHAPVIYTVNSDGSDLTSLGRGQDPAWSPDGTKIAFIDQLSVAVMNADGSGRTAVTHTSDEKHNPAWSPDGNRIAFDQFEILNARHQLFVINADGTGETQLTYGFVSRRDPSWSPGGSELAFISGDGFALDLHTIDPNGTDEAVVVARKGNESGPDWSPDGATVAFGSCCEHQQGGVFAVTRDGTQLTQLTDRDDFLPGWSPDGSQLAVVYSRWPGRGIYVRNADGTSKRLVALTREVASAPSWQPIPGPRRADFRNTNQFCKAEQAFWGDQFASRYGGAKNPYGKCVSGK